MNRPRPGHILGTDCTNGQSWYVIGTRANGDRAVLAGFGTQGSASKWAETIGVQCELYTGITVEKAAVAS
jgi:hypothetical protein